MDNERFPDHEDPEVLCQRAKRGDRDSFNRLVRLFQPKVFKLVLSILRHREDALDAVQETFMKVYSGLNSYQAGKGFEAWLLRIAKNVAIDHYRYEHSKRRWSREKESLSSLESSLASPANDHSRKEMRYLIEKALSRLADKQRLVFLLRYLQGYSFEEIAAIMGLATGTVKSLHFKAFEKMKMFIKESLETGDQL